MQSLLEYTRFPETNMEDVMASVSQELLQSIAEVLARVPVDPTDLATNVVQLGSQLDGLARLDDLDLLTVEPATVLVPPAGTPHGR
jgi:hypothetical protein